MWAHFKFLPSLINKGINITNSHNEQATTYFDNSPVEDIKEVFEAQIALLCKHFQSQIDALSKDVEFYRNIISKNVLNLS